MQRGYTLACLLHMFIPLAGPWLEESTVVRHVRRRGDVHGGRTETLAELLVAHAQRQQEAMDSLAYVDTLIKEYLLFRGFTVSLQAFNTELAADRGCGFQVLASAWIVLDSWVSRRARCVCFPHCLQRCRRRAKSCLAAPGVAIHPLLNMYVGCARCTWH